MYRLAFLILFSFSFLLMTSHDVFSQNDRKDIELKKEQNDLQINKEFHSAVQWMPNCLRKEEKIFVSLKKAEEYLECLLKEREVLVGDFYGINVTAYRYVNIFDRLRYIRYRIKQIDRKIAETKSRISELKKKHRKSVSGDTT